MRRATFYNWKNLKMDKRELMGHMFEAPKVVEYILLHSFHVTCYKGKTHKCNDTDHIRQKICGLQKTIFVLE